MKTEKVTFKNFKGETLSAKFEKPVDNNFSSCAVFAHCFTCSKNLNAVTNISRALTQNGIAVLRFDFTGLGESEGEFADTNFSSNVDDILAAVSFTEEKFHLPSVLIGHSLGGAAVLIAATKLPKLKAVATIGAPFEPAHVTHHVKNNIDEIKTKGEAEVSIGGRPFTIKKQFLEDLEKFDADKKIREIKKPLLILHSPQDLIVGIENAAKIYQAAVHPKSFISLDGADHLLTNKEDSVYAGTMIANWLKKYLPVQKPQPLETDKQVIVRTSENGYTTDIKTRNHFLTADEPAEVGGNDLGPTPYDLLLAALGACTSMTLRMYADRKKWNINEIKVHLQHSKTYSTDCDNCDSSSSKIDFIERILEIDGNLSGEQKSRLIEIADKCPVHRTLHSQIKVETKLKD